MHAQERFYIKWPRKIRREVTAKVIILDALFPNQVKVEIQLEDVETHAVLNINITQKECIKLAEELMKASKAKPDKEINALRRDTQKKLRAFGLGGSKVKRHDNKTAYGF